MDALFGIIKTLIAPPSLIAPLLIICVAHLAVIPYFAMPEKFFIKKLRLQELRHVSHTQLALRSFGGIGLVYSGLYALAFTLNNEMSGWEFAQRWLTLTLGGFLIVGTGSYLVLRMRTRRRPSEQRELRRIEGDDRCKKQE